MLPPQPVRDAIPSAWLRTGRWRAATTCVQVAVHKEEKMDQEIREFLDRKFNAIDEKFKEIRRDSDRKFEETKQYSDRRFEETKQYFGVVAEGLRSEIQQVAEGHEVIRNEIQSLRQENEQAHKEIVAAIKFSYA